MDHNNAVLGEGEVRVPLPAEPVGVLLLIRLGVVVRGKHDGADIRHAQPWTGLQPLKSYHQGPQRGTLAWSPAHTWGRPGTVVIYDDKNVE